MPGRSALLVDMHTHVVGKEFVRQLKAHPAEAGAVPGQLRLLLDGKMGPVGERLTEPSRKLRDLDAMRLDKAVLSPPPFSFLYRMPAGAAAPLIAAQNDETAALVAAHPDRFAGMAAVPLQDPAAAAEEATRAVRTLRLCGVAIGSNVAGRDLDADELFPFFARVEALGVPLFIHPVDVLGGERLRDYYLTNLIGNPMDTTVAAARLVFGGVLARLPRLRLILSHGGGAFPFLRGRLEHGFAVRPEPKAKGASPPSAYLGQLYVDTILFYPPAVEYAIATLGEEHVLLGSDYPFDMGVADPVGAIEALRRPPDPGKARILGGNAARLFNLS
jgi:aminocarboxymuconate-semialdehyde decarboxylase